MNINFRDQVVVITGAAGSIGRSYAKLFAARGATLLLNDKGTNLDGTKSDTSALDDLVNVIQESGGIADANYNSIADENGAKNLIQEAIKTYGRIDVLVNNAGNMRDQVFKKMDYESFKSVLDVHLFGSLYTAHEAFPIMIEQNYGRILMTTSAAGLYGAFGGTSYSTAKAGIIGMTKTLSIEGKKHNINVNAIAPVAVSRMLGTMLSDEDMERCSPNTLAPAALYLCSRECIQSGEIISAGGGYFSKVQIMEGAGVRLPTDETLTPEMIADNYDEISSMKEARSFADVWEALSEIIGMGLER